MGANEGTETLGKLNLLELPGYLSSLLSNPTYMCVCIAESLDGFGVAGGATFLPKVLEHAFSLSGGQAGQLVGLLVVPAGGGGTFIGGWIIKKFELDRGKILLMCALS